MIIDYDDMVSVSFINLERRKDRLQSVNSNLSEMKFDISRINRFSAIENEFGEIGCAKSHKTLCEQLRDKSNARYHLVFEDDFRFTKQPIFLVDLISKLEQKEILFDFFNLYGEYPIAIRKKKISIENNSYLLFRLFNSYTTGCYLIPCRSLPFIIEHFSNCEITLDKHLKRMMEGNFEEKFRSFTPKQNPSFRVFLANLHSIDQSWRNLMLEKMFLGINLEFGYIEESASDVESRADFKKNLKVLKKISDLT